MFGMLGFLDMAGNHNERVVRNDKTDDFTLDTALVTDRNWRYETAVEHKDFNDGDWIILDGCNSKELAVEMHDKWLTKLLNEDITELTDYYTGEVFRKEVNQ